jgi:hypothetical protein
VYFEFGSATLIIASVSACYKEREREKKRGKSEQNVIAFVSKTAALPLSSTSD